MEFFILNLVLLFFTYQFHDVSARRQRPGRYGDGYDDHEYYNYEDNEDDPNDLSDHCIHIRIDHDIRLTDYLLCPYGCCGTLDDQKCCEDPEKAKHEAPSSGNVHLVRGVLIFAGVMLIVAVSSCVFGIYKHKKAKLRKTSPARNAETRTPIARTAPYTIFYTPRNGMTCGLDSKSRPTPNKQSDRIAPVHERTVPPRCTEKSEADEDGPPYSVQSPPPPYSLSTPATASMSTEVQISI